MKPLLFLTQRIPFPPDKGDKLRSFAILRHLSRLWDIHLGCFVDDPADRRHEEALRDYCVDLCCLPLDRRRATLASAAGLLTGQSLSERFYRSSRLQDWVDRVLRQRRPAAALVYSGVMGQYLLKRPAAETVRLVTDFVDVDSAKWLDYAERRRGPAASIYRRESRTLAAFERRLAQRSQASVLVSAPEATLLRGLAPEAAERISVITNGVDHGYFAPDPRRASPFPPDQAAIVMTGAMDYWPNEDAALFFAEAVLPALRQGLPRAHFHVVGRNPTGRLRRLRRQDGVDVTGRVDDVRPYLQHAALVVAPMRVGRGIQNKILEGMAMARPVLTSPVGFAGIDAEPDRHLLVADGSGQWIAASLAVLNDRVTADAIGAEARRRIVAAYDWQDKLAAFDGLLASP